MNVSLTPELERIISEKVSSGLYNNASEVVREALRHYIETGKRRAWFDAEIQKGVDDFAAGRVHEPTDEFWEKLKKDGRARAKERLPKAG